MSRWLQDILRNQPESTWPDNVPDLPQGTKFDDGKLRWDLLPWEALACIVAVLTFGAKKYASWNWAKGINYSRVRAALQRHLVAWDTGETFDPETKIHHLGHAGCCLLFLLSYELFPKRFAQFDDRFMFNIAVNEGGTHDATRSVHPA